jgi:hypothetical protein
MNAGYKAKQDNNKCLGLDNNLSLIKKVDSNIKGIKE